MSDLIIGNDVIEGVVAEQAEIVLPTYDQLYADFQQSKVLHANTLVREKLLQEALTAAKSLSLEDRLQQIIEDAVEEAINNVLEAAVEEAVEDAMRTNSDEIDDRIERYLDNNLEDAVTSTVRDMSFSVHVD